MAASVVASARTIVVVGKESVGKSQLISSITGQHARTDNFRGSTVTCETYVAHDVRFIDTPGILLGSDTLTTETALQHLNDDDAVLLLVQSTTLASDLNEALALVKEHPCVMVLTFWDKMVNESSATAFIETLRDSLGISVVTVDARHISASKLAELRIAIDSPRRLLTNKISVAGCWKADPSPSIFDAPIAGVVFSFMLLFLPALSATVLANALAGVIDTYVERFSAPLAAQTAHLPALLHELLGGTYGLVTMGPLLLVWALPTVVLYSIFLGVYKASGLLDRISSAIHPFTRRVGLSGRDIIRVLMGYGCNVPAVISTRACSRCSRSTTINTIAFGSVCSYQFSATIGVFAAARRPGLIVPFMLYVLVTTIVVARITSTPAARSPLNVLTVDGRTYLQRPTGVAIWREARSSIVSFLRKAMPIFVGISLLASLLSWCGALEWCASLCAPALRLFHLPAQAALPVILASIRKDGILILARTVPSIGLSNGQLLTAVYLTGQFVPCLVTVLTIVRECSGRFALRLVGRQIFAATVFSLILAEATWIGGL